MISYFSSCFLLGLSFCPQAAHTYMSFSSFIYHILPQLNRWSFIKVLGAKETYSQAYFRRGQFALCQEITCSGVRGTADNSAEEFWFYNQRRDAIGGPERMIMPNSYNNFNYYAAGGKHNTDATACLPTGLGAPGLDDCDFVRGGKDLVGPRPPTTPGLGWGGYSDNLLSLGDPQNFFPSQTAAEIFPSNAGSMLAQKQPSSADLAADAMVVALTNAREEEELHHEARYRQMNIAQIQQRMVTAQTSRYPASASFPIDHTRGSGDLDMASSTSPRFMSSQERHLPASMNNTMLMNRNDMMVPSIFAAQRQRGMMQQQMAMQLQMTYPLSATRTHLRTDQINGNSFTSHVPRQFLMNQRQMEVLSAASAHQDQTPDSSPQSVGVPRDEHRDV